MSANPDRRPRLFAVLESNCLAAIAHASGTDGNPNSQSPFSLAYEAMNPDERAEALEHYEMEIEWFFWEYLSTRRSTRTSRGVDIIQKIAGNIVSCFLMSHFSIR